MENQQSEDNEILISTLELQRAWNDVDNAAGVWNEKIPLQITHN